MKIGGKLTRIKTDLTPMRWLT